MNGRACASPVGGRGEQANSRAEPGATQRPIRPESRHRAMAGRRGQNGKLLPTAACLLPALPRVSGSLKKTPAQQAPPFT